MNNKTSKKISYLLRHNPKGLSMDDNGYVLVSDLLKKINITIYDLIDIVDNNDKQRFSFNDDRTKIRANQGHSLKDINLDLKEVEPPTYLYHGTSPSFLKNIKINGILKRNRNHVHLTDDVKTAYNVGKRHSKDQDPSILMIKSKLMSFNGFKFYKSENGVWLSDNIPPEYFTEIVYNE